MPLRLGTRASALARWQAEWVAARLREQGVDVELVPISTTGDQQQGRIQAVGGQGLFTKEIQRALLDDRIDLAVHSLKDLPTGDVSGLCLAAVPERGPIADVLVTNKGVGSRFLTEEPGRQRQDNNDFRPLWCVGTGSLRRRAQLLHFRPDLQMRDIRGNVETRLRKLHQGDFDAIVLAEAGLRRLGLDQHIAQVLPLDVMLPAVGQGALALETRADDGATCSLVATLDHPPTHAAVLAERAMLAALQGGCLAPIAGLGCVEGGQLKLTGRVISHDGVKRLEAAAHAILPAPDQPSVGARRGTGGEGGCPCADWAIAASTAVQLGQRVAEALLAQGASELIGAARRL
jgi:hydroxymethylbilane synthase